MREIDIDKIDGDHVIPPHEGLTHGYHGYTPDDDDADTHTVAVQGPLAEKANQPSDGNDAKKATSRASAAKKEADK